MENAAFKDCSAVTVLLFVWQHLHAWKHHAYCRQRLLLHTGNAPNTAAANLGISDVFIPKRQQGIQGLLNFAHTILFQCLACGSYSTAALFAMS